LASIDWKPMKRQSGADARGAKRQRSKALLPIAACGISLCYFLISIYESGDFYRYQSYFSGVNRFGVLEGYLYYRNVLGAPEPVYYLITWFISSLGVKYFAFKVAIASCLYIILSATLLRFGIPGLMIILFCSTNFYQLALYSELERLSVAMIFILLGLQYLSQGKSVRAILFGALALGSHSQTAILLLAIGLGKQVESITLHGGIKKLSLKALFGQALALGFTVAAVVAFMVSPLGGVAITTLEQKIDYYSGSSGIASLVQAALFFPLMFLFSKNRLRDTVIYAVISVFIFVFGGERLNIFLAMFVLMLAFANSRWKHPLALLAHVYFTVKGLQFISLVIETGRGYG
jgi:hypothetical protein